MSLAEQAAKWQAKRTGAMWFFALPGRVSLEPFEGFDFVALPSGEVLDAVPVPPIGTVDRISSGLLLLEAFA